MNRYFFIFVHVPKTGGSTMKNILRSNFRENYREEYSAFWEPAFTPKQIDDFIANNENSLALASHRLNVNLPYDSDNAKVVGIAYTRDPVERVISQYFFNRNNRPGYKNFAKDVDLRRYVEIGLQDGKLDWLIDGVYKFLTRDHGNLDMDSIKTLIATRKLLLFPLERFDQSCLLLEKLYPKFFRNTSYVRENLAKRTEVVDNDIRDLIRLHVQKDYELHRLANEQIEALTSENFKPKEIARAQQLFQRRCLRRKLFVWAPRRAGGFVLRKLGLR